MRVIVLIISVFILYNTHSIASESEINAIDNPISDQYDNFGKHIQESILNGSPIFINSSFAFDSFMKKIFVQQTINSDPAFNENFKSSFLSSFNLGNMIIDEIKNNGSYTYLNSFKRDGNIYLLFRLFSDNGINYHELEITEINGELYINDILIYHIGENISATISRIYDSMVHSGSKNNKPHAYIEMQVISKLLEKGKNNKAYSYWQSLPDNIRNSKEFLVLGLQIASKINQNEYNKVYELYKASYPENASKYLIPLESLVTTQNYLQALICIDSLDKKISHDPMLNLIKANILFEMNDHKEAMNSLSLLIEEMPNFEEGYFSLLKIFMYDKAYSQATVLLDKMVVNLNYYKSSLQNLLINFPDFCKSKEFQNWINQ